MKKLSAFGAIGMLITLLIIGLLFIILMPTLKDVGGGAFGPSSLNKGNVEREMNNKIDEVEYYKNKNIEYVQQSTQE